MKTILITGSTDGIGKLTAFSLATYGHRVFIHGRDKAKLENVISEIRNKTGNQKIQGFTADLSNIQNIRSLAEEIYNSEDSIDVLINNAGVYMTNESKNAQGLDMRFMVNYLAPYLLTNHLLNLYQGNIERIINLSSAAQSPVSLKALQGEENVPESEAYAQSKLALTMWSFQLAEKVKETTVIAVNPGSLLNTNMVKKAFGKHWSPADKGSKILVNLAISDKYKTDTGKYFDNDKEAFGAAHADAYNKPRIEDLLKVTERLVKS